MSEADGAADTDTEISNDSKLQRLEYAWDLMSQEDRFLREERNQTIQSERQLLGFAGISIIPAMFGDFHGFGKPSLVLFTIGMVFLTLAVGTVCVNLGIKRVGEEPDIQKFRDFAWTVTRTESTTKTEEYLIKLLDQCVANHKEHIKQQDHRVSVLKWGYRAYAASLPFIALAFLIQ